MRVLVLGWFGHNNIGDESYKLTMPKFFAGHELQFTDFITTSHLEWCDVVVLGGGNVIKPYFIDQVVNSKKPAYALSVGAESKACEKPIFSHVWGRDAMTLDILKEIGQPSSYLPDLAYLLEPNIDSGREWIRDKFKSEGLDLYEKVVVVVLNAYLMKGGQEVVPRDAFHFLDISYRLGQIVDETSASFVFLPFGTDPSSDDRAANAWVSSKCKWWKKNYVSHERLSVQKTLDIMSASDFTISSRLHSTIFSHLSSVPFADLTHHSKNNEFLKSIGKNDCSFSYWNLNADLLHEKIKEGLVKKPHTGPEEYRKLLQKEMNDLRSIESGENSRSSFRTSVCNQ